MGISTTYARAICRNGFFFVTLQRIRVLLLSKKTCDGKFVARCKLILSNTTKQNK